MALENIISFSIVLFLASSFQLRFDAEPFQHLIWIEVKNAKFAAGYLIICVYMWQDLKILSAQEKKIISFISPSNRWYWLFCYTLLKHNSIQVHIISSTSRIIIFRFHFNITVDFQTTKFTITIYTQKKITLDFLLLVDWMLRRWRRCLAYESVGNEQ